MTLEFTGAIWHWRGPSPWFFVTVPAEQSSGLRSIAAAVTYGWGMLPATVHIGATAWQTALFPKDGCYLVPIRATVRHAEGLAEGDEVTVRLTVG